LRAVGHLDWLLRSVMGQEDPLIPPAVKGGGYSLGCGTVAAYGSV